jgi:carbonic anhydrase
MRAWRSDLTASFVVVLIAVPLTLGIAVASGAPLVAGLVAAVVGGIVAGALGGSAVQVSGPAAGLTVIVAGLVQQYGWAATCAIVTAAGVLQLMLGLSRLARAALAVSPNVIHGMLAGVGVVIALSQVHILLGGTPQGSALENLRQLPGEILEHDVLTVAVGSITLGVLLLWPRLPRRVRVVPAPLVAVAAGTLAATVARWDVPRVSLPDAPLDLLVMPQLPHGGWGGIVTAVVSVALVASVESLLCAVAVDRLHSGPRANLDRELVGQGAGNLLSGLLGGLPIAGVIVRSTANVTAGGRSRRSTFLHGVWVLLVVVAAAPAIELIPLASLAALLVFIGLQMVKLAHLRGARRHGELVAYLATGAGVVALGLIEGVVIGIVVALALTVRRLACITVDIDGSLVSVSGSLTFLSVPTLTRRLAEVPAGSTVDLRLNVDFMDHAGVTAIDDWRANHENTGGTVTIDEVHEPWYRTSSSGLPMPTRKPPPPLRWRQAWSTAPTADPRGLLQDGADEFHRRAAPGVRPLLSALARNGQRPIHLFLTCADSRLVPNLITSSGPGDLFTVRNVGNLVPRNGATSDVDSTIAAIEYAVNVLPVRTITVCGHSGCGAMAALLEPPAANGMPHLNGWLRHGLPSLDRMRRSSADSLDALCVANVRQQVDNLLTYPAVAERVANGSLELVGAHFDISKGELRLLPSAEPSSAPAGVA